MPTVSEKDFLDYIIPHLQRCDRFPMDMENNDIQSFYRALYATVTNNPAGWKQHSALFDLYGVENMDFETIVNLTNSAIWCLDKIRQAESEGYISVKGLSAYEGTCAACRDGINKQKFNVKTLLAAYKTRTHSPGMLPHPHCTLRWCRCSLVACDQPLPPGVDPKFAAWLEENLKL